MSKRRYINFDIVGGCFLCTSHAGDKDGYPIVRINGEKWRINRFIYTQMFGGIPDRMMVRHTCDNPSCINPEHLIVGTHTDNMRDAIERGRKAIHRPIGLSNGMTKLTDAQRAEIRGDGRTLARIAADYGVSETTIRRVKTRGVM